MVERKKKSRMSKLLLLISTVILERIRATNLLASFPRMLNIYKDDYVGFQIDNFINGTMTKSQVFPEPTINKGQSEKRVHTFEHDPLQSGAVYCNTGGSVTPLEFVLICTSSRQKDSKSGLSISSTVVVYQRFDETMSLINGKEYHIELQNEVEKVNQCDDVKITSEGAIFVSCYKRADPAKGDWDAVLYVLRPDTNGGKHSLKVTTKYVYTGFILATLLPQKTDPILSNLVSLTHTKTSEGVYRIGLYQKKVPQNQLKSTDKILVVDYNIRSTSIVQIYKGKWLSSIMKASFGAEKWIYGQNSENKNLVACRIPDTASTPINCTASVPFETSSISSFSMKYDWKPETMKSTLFFVTSKEFGRCIYNLKKFQHPFDISKAECKKLKLFFTTSQTLDLMAGDFQVDMSEQRALVSFYSKKLERNTNLAGYLKIESSDHTAQYIDLSKSQGSLMSLVNSSYYILHRGKISSLHQTTEEKFFIRAPESETSSSVYLSAYSPALNEEPFVVNTMVNRIDDEFGGLFVDKIQEVSLYTQDFDGVYTNTTGNKTGSGDFIVKDGQRIPCHILGYNSKILRGNDIKVEKINIGHVDSNGNKIYPNAEDRKKLESDSDLYKVMRVSGDKFSTKKNSRESVPNLKIHFPEELKSEIKKYFSADHGVFVFQTVNQKMMAVKCGVENHLVKDVNCKLLINITMNGYDIQQVTFQKQKLYIVVKKQNGGSIELFGFNETMGLFITANDTKNRSIMEKGALISRIDADVDVNVFADDIYVVSITNYDLQTKTKAKLVLQKFVINEETVTAIRRFELIFENNGVPNFKKSGVAFLGDQTKYLYVVNKHHKDYSLIKVLYAQVSNGYPLIIQERTPIRYLNGGAPTDDKSSITMCLTLKSIFLFNNETKYIYGSTLDAPSETIITVPLGEMAKGRQKRTVDSIICSPNHETFQLIVRDELRTADYEYYLVTYFDFDGSQAAKKVHSSILLPHSKAYTLSSSISDLSKNFILSLTYSPSQGIRLAEPLLINLNGPFITLCFNKYYYSVDFKTEIRPILEQQEGISEQDIEAERAKYNNLTLFRRQLLNLLQITFITGKNKTITSEVGFRLKSIEQTQAKFKELVAIPSSAPNKEKLSSYISATGPIFEVRLRPIDNSNTYIKDLNTVIKIQQKLEIIDETGTGVIKPCRYMNNSVILDSVGDLVLVKDIDNNLVILYKQIDKVRHTFNMSDSQQYGVDCNNFKLVSLGRTVYVNFICEKDLDTILRISSFEIHEGTSQTPLVKKLPYDIQNLRYTHNEDYIFLTMKELNGNRLVVWRIERKRGDLSEIIVKSRVPGDLSLFPYSVFNLVAIKTMTVLTILSPGQNFFRVMLLDFQTLALKDSKTVYSVNRTAIHYIGFGKGMTGTPSIVGIAGGIGADIFEYEIDIVENTKTIGDVKTTQSFQKFFTEKSVVKDIVALGDYYMLTGNFGKMEISNEAIKENEVPSGNIAPGPNPSNSSQNQTMVKSQAKPGSILRETKHLIYKRGVPEVFMRGYGDGNHGSLQRINDQDVYVTSEGGAIKYYKIQDFSITEISSKTRRGQDKKPTLYLYSYRKTKELSIYLSMKDVEESFLYQTITIAFILGVIVLCVITYKLAKKLEKDSIYDMNTDKILFEFEEVDKRFSDQNIIEEYFGGKRRVIITEGKSNFGRQISNVITQEGNQLNQEKNISSVVMDMKKDDDDEELVNREEEDDLAFLGGEKEKDILAIVDEDGEEEQVEAVEDDDDLDSSDA